MPHQTPARSETALYQQLQRPRQALVVLLLLVAAWYLTWRLSSFNPHARLFSAVLYAAELWGIVTTLLHLFMVWRLTVRIAPPPPAGFTVDVRASRPAQCRTCATENAFRMQRIDKNTVRGALVRTCYVAAIMLALMASTGAQGAEGYLCIVDKATGFSYQQGRWDRAFFRNEDKYLITRSSEPKRVWEVKQLGERWAFVWCAEEFNEADDLSCEGIAEVRMNRKSLRFLYIYPNGYLRSLPGEAEGENTPYVGIGTCSPL